MTTKKDRIYTMTAALGIIKSAVKQITDCKSANTDVIIYNNLNKAISKKGVK